MADIETDPFQPHEKKLLLSMNILMRGAIHLKIFWQGITRIPSWPLLEMDVERSSNKVQFQFKGAIGPPVFTGLATWI